MARLTMNTRRNLSKNEFALPSKAPRSGSYPIPDSNHARAALSMVAAHGSPAEKSKVRAAVHNKFPEIGKMKPPAHKVKFRKPNER